MIIDLWLNIIYNYDSLFFPQLWEESDLVTNLVTWRRQRDFNQGHYLFIYFFIMEQYRPGVAIRPTRRCIRKQWHWILGVGAGRGVNHILRQAFHPVLRYKDRLDFNSVLRHWVTKQAGECISRREWGMHSAVTLVPSRALADPHPRPSPCPAPTPSLPHALLIANVL